MVKTSEQAIHQKKEKIKDKEPTHKALKIQSLELLPEHTESYPLTKNSRATRMKSNFLKMNF
jgi:hypothetical protein